MSRFALALCLLLCCWISPANAEPESDSPAPQPDSKVESSSEVSKSHGDKAESKKAHKDKAHKDKEHKVKAHSKKAGPQCQEAVKAQHLINIPIFFITDRNREPCHDKNQYAAFGKLRQYKRTCNHDPYVGVAYCAIENNRLKPLTPELEKLGWQSGQKHKEGAFSVSLVEGCTYEEAKDKFYDDLYKKTLETPDRNMLVFAPGYMSTFESGLKEAARFAYYAERPVLLYSWPSKGAFKAYSADEASIEWSQDHYNEMIEELAQLSEKQPPPAIRLIAHSMGSRLLLRASPLIKSKNVFAEVTFVCPDVDDGVVKHYIRACLDKDNKAMVRLYMSHKDEMLKLSQFVHGGYKRLGEDDGFVESLSPYKQKDNQCHAGVVSAEALKRFQTIDFTTLDTGTLGHKIPVHLITSMSLSGEPPCDVEIEKKEKHHADCSEVMMDIASLNDGQGEETISYFKVKPVFKRAPVISAVKGKLPVLHTFFGKDWTMK
jgi:esterase/lipase superfamily enzyme